MRQYFIASVCATLLVLLLCAVFLASMQGSGAAGIVFGGFLLFAVIAVWMNGLLASLLFIRRNPPVGLIATLCYGIPALLMAPVKEWCQSWVDDGFAQARRAQRFDSRFRARDWLRRRLDLTASCRIDDVDVDNYFNCVLWDLPAPEVMESLRMLGFGPDGETIPMLVRRATPLPEEIRGERPSLPDEEQRIARIIARLRGWGAPPLQKDQDGKTALEDCEHCPAAVRDALTRFNLAPPLHP
jgi:hypothetical protein